MAWLISVIALLAVLYGPGLWVRRVMRRYAEPRDRYAVTGAELAQEFLQRLGLHGVQVEASESRGDHYDPEARAVRLSHEHYAAHSLAALTVAAHEVGHAVQHAAQYGPFMWRQRLVRAASRGQQVGSVLLLAAPAVAGLLRAPGLAALLVGAGVLSLASQVVVHLLTVPTELDASFRRALPLLERSGYLDLEVDRPHAQRLLKAAAWTYVAQSLGSLLNFWAWLRALRAAR